MPPKSSDSTIPPRQSTRVTRKPTPNPTTVASLPPPSLRLPSPSLPLPSPSSLPPTLPPPSSPPRSSTELRLEALARSVSSWSRLPASPPLPPPSLLAIPPTPPPVLPLPPAPPSNPPPPKSRPKGATLTDKLAASQEQTAAVQKRLEDAQLQHLDSVAASKKETERLMRLLREERTLRDAAQLELTLAEQRLKVFINLQSHRETALSSATIGWKDAELRLTEQELRWREERSRLVETHRKELEDMRIGEKERMDSWKIARGWKEVVALPGGRSRVEDEHGGVDPVNQINHINITELELAERHSISTNVVLFGVESPPSSSPEQLLAIVLTSLPSSLNAPSPTLVIRKSKAPKSAPLILTFADHADRATYLLALKSIPNNPLSARHDLTRAQQLHRRLLVSDAEELKKRGHAAVVRGDRVIVREDHP